MTAMLIFFYVVMSGFWQAESSMVFPVTNSINSSRFAGDNAMPPERAAFHTGIEASRPSR